MCPDSSLFSDTMKIMEEENVPATTYLKAMLLANIFLLLLVSVEASL